MFRETRNIAVGGGGGRFAGGFGAPGQRPRFDQNPKGEHRTALLWHGLRYLNNVSVIVGVFATAIFAGPHVFGVGLLAALAKAAFNRYDDMERDARSARALLGGWLFLVGLGIFWLAIGASAAMPVMWPHITIREQVYYPHSIHAGVRIVVLCLIAAAMWIHKDLDYRASTETTDPPWPGPVGMREASAGPLGPDNPYPGYWDEDERDDLDLGDLVREIVAQEVHKARDVPVMAKAANGHNGNGAKPLPAPVNPDNVAQAVKAHVEAVEGAGFDLTFLERFICHAAKLNTLSRDAMCKKLMDGGEKLQQRSADDDSPPGWAECIAYLDEQGYTTKSGRATVWAPGQSALTALAGISHGAPPPRPRRSSVVTGGENERTTDGRMDEATAPPENGGDEGEFG